MSQELHYTSVPRGLKPGSRGFCTVAATPHLPGPLVDRLEALSGYQPVFPPHDPSAALNPVVFSQLRLTVAGRVVSVLSRIGPSGLDYSGRPNKYAHHVVLEGNERPEGGPAWVLSQPGFMQAGWDGEPREIPTGRTPGLGDRPPGVARAWQALTGDAGWAGVLAESFLADQRRPVFLVFRTGMELLPLFVEALALMLTSRRWDVDFSTYFSQLPQGVNCTWRGLLEGSPEAANARRLPNALVLDLCQPLGRADGGALVHLARTGERLPQEPVKTTAPPGSGWHTPRIPHDPAVPATDQSGQTAASLPRITAGDYYLIPELARLAPGPNYAGPSQRRRKRRWAVVAAITAVCLVVLVAAGVLLRIDSVMKLRSVSSEVGQVIATSGEKATGARREPEIAEQAIKSVMAQAQAETEAKTVMKDWLAKKTKKPKRGPEPTVVKLPEQNAGRPGIGPTPPPSLKQGPLIRFIGLPATPERRSMLPNLKSRERTDAQNVEFKKVGLKNHYILFSNTLNLSELFKKPKPGETLEIETQSASHTGGVIPVASLGIVNREALSFRWDDRLWQSSRRDELTAAVRDIVVKIQPEEGNEDYLLLRDPRPLSNDTPFDLKKVTNQQFDHFRQRHLTFPWAAKKDALVGTRWNLGIRRWRIVNRLSKAGPDKIIAAGEQGNGEMKEEIVDNINDGDVKLWIKIKHDERHLIQVILEFDSIRIKDHNEKRDRIFRDYQINLTKPREDSSNPPTNRGDDPRAIPLEVHQSLERLREELGREVPMVNNMRISKADLNDLKEIVSKEMLYNFMDKSQLSNLSLVVGLKLNDGTILDIASFGKFADSQP